MWQHLLRIHESTTPLAYAPSVSAMRRTARQRVKGTGPPPPPPAAATAETGGDE